MPSVQTSRCYWTCPRCRFVHEKRGLYYGPDKNVDYLQCGFCMWEGRIEEMLMGVDAWQPLPRTCTNCGLSVVATFNQKCENCGASAWERTIDGDLQ